MKCAHCQFDIAANFAFCPQCGNKVVTSAALAVGAATEADRRMATVLFADVSGFTAISERLDPEDVRALQTDLFGALRGVIAHYDGFLEKFVGDAVMAAFGAPVAHEDDPQRALHAALDMHARAAELSERWQKRLGQPLMLHIGINTGRVVAGTLGSASDSAYAVTGDTVNTAARLQAAAGAGQTLVSRATFQLAQQGFRFESASALALKGKSEPFPVHRLLGADITAHTLRGLAAHGLTSPLVGRDAEMAQMRDAAARAREGRAQVVSLVGEAGVGKTRLIDGLMQHTASAWHFQPAVRRTQCSPLNQRPFGAIAGLFREAYGIVPTDGLGDARAKVEHGMRSLGADDAEVSLVLPVLGHMLGLQAAGPTGAVRHVSDIEIEPERLKRQIFMALRTVLDRRLAQGPVVLVVEDLQWADAASIEGMTTLADWLCERPLLVVLSGRPPVDPATLHFGRAGHVIVRLAPLADSAIEAQLAALFGSAGAYPIERALHERIVGQAGGNPLYLEEVLRGLISAGVLVRAAGSWRCMPDAATVEVPSSIEGLLLSRLDRLPPRARRTLQSAAILGAEFDSPLLAAVDEEAGDPAMLALLCDTEWLVRVRAGNGPPAPHPAPRYRFASTLAHDVAYQNLLLRRRTELHQRAGSVLEGLHGTHPERLEDLESLCHHFARGQDQVRGARYLVAAGDWARGIYANEDALRDYDRALCILEADAAHDVLAISGIREHMGDLLGPIGRRDQARTQYNAVLAWAGATADTVREARMQRKLAGLHWDAGERDSSFACLRQGLRLLETIGTARAAAHANPSDPATAEVGAGVDADIELAHLYQEMGRLAFRTGDNQAAVDWGERALQQAERAARRSSGDADAHRAATAAVSHALNTLGAALARLDRSAEAVAKIERSVAVAEEAGLLQAACRSYANLGVLYATLDPGRAVTTCRMGLDTAKKIGDLGFQSRLYANLAVAYCALTQRCDDEGVQAAQSAIDLDRQLGQIDHLAVPLIVLGQIYQCHGQPATALRYYREALELAERMGEPQLMFPCLEGMATVYLDQGDDARAEAYFVQADTVCNQAGVDRDSLVVLPFLC